MVYENSMEAKVLMAYDQKQQMIVPTLQQIGKLQKADPEDEDDIADQIDEWQNSFLVNKDRIVVPCLSQNNLLINIKVKQAPPPISNQNMDQPQQLLIEKKIKIIAKMNSQVMLMSQDNLDTHNGSQYQINQHKSTSVRQKKEDRSDEKQISSKNADKFPSTQKDNRSSLSSSKLLPNNNYYNGSSGQKQIFLKVDNKDLQKNSERNVIDPYKQGVSNQIAKPLKLASDLQQSKSQVLQLPKQVSCVSKVSGDSLKTVQQETNSQRKVSAGAFNQTSLYSRQLGSHNQNNKGAYLVSATPKIGISQVVHNGLNVKSKLKELCITERLYNSQSKKKDKIIELIEAEKVKKQIQEERELTFKPATNYSSTARQNQSQTLLQKNKDKNQQNINNSGGQMQIPKQNIDRFALEQKQKHEAFKQKIQQTQEQEFQEATKKHRISKNSEAILEQKKITDPNKNNSTTDQRLYQPTVSAKIRVKEQIEEVISKSKSKQLGSQNHKDLNQSSTQPKGILKLLDKIEPPIVQKIQMPTDKPNFCKSNSPKSGVQDQLSKSEQLAKQVPKRFKSPDIEKFALSSPSIKVSDPIIKIITSNQSHKVSQQQNQTSPIKQNDKQNRETNQNWSSVALLNSNSKLYPTRDKIVYEKLKKQLDKWLSLNNKTSDQIDNLVSFKFDLDSIKKIMRDLDFIDCDKVTVDQQALITQLWTESLQINGECDKMIKKQNVLVILAAIKNYRVSEMFYKDETSCEEDLKSNQIYDVFRFDKERLIYYTSTQAIDIFRRRYQEICDLQRMQKTLKQKKLNDTPADILPQKQLQSSLSQAKFAGRKMFSAVKPQQQKIEGVRSTSNEKQRQPNSQFIQSGIFNSNSKNEFNFNEKLVDKAKSSFQTQPRILITQESQLQFQDNVDTLLRNGIKSQSNLLVQSKDQNLGRIEKDNINNDEIKIQKIVQRVVKQNKPKIQVKQLNNIKKYSSQQRLQANRESLERPLEEYIQSTGEQSVTVMKQPKGKGKKQPKEEPIIEVKPMVNFGKLAPTFFESEEDQSSSEDGANSDKLSFKDKSRALQLQNPLSGKYQYNQIALEKQVDDKMNQSGFLVPKLKLSNLQSQFQQSDKRQQEEQKQALAQKNIKEKMAKNVINKATLQVPVAKNRQQKDDIKLPLNDKFNQLIQLNKAEQIQFYTGVPFKKPDVKDLQISFDSMESSLSPPCSPDLTNQSSQFSQKLSFPKRRQSDNTVVSILREFNEKIKNSLNMQHAGDPSINLENNNITLLTQSPISLIKPIKMNQIIPKEQLVDTVLQTTDKIPVENSMAFLSNMLEKTKTENQQKIKKDKQQSSSKKSTKKKKPTDLQESLKQGISNINILSHRKVMDDQALIDKYITVSGNPKQEDSPENNLDYVNNDNTNQAGEQTNPLASMLYRSNLLSNTKESQHEYGLSPPSRNQKHSSGGQHFLNPAWKLLEQIIEKKNQEAEDSSGGGGSARSRNGLHQKGSLESNLDPKSHQAQLQESKDEPKIPFLVANIHNEGSKKYFLLILESDDNVKQQIDEFSLKKNLSAGKTLDLHTKIASRIKKYKKDTRYLQVPLEYYLTTTNSNQDNQGEGAHHRDEKIEMAARIQCCYRLFESEEEERRWERETQEKELLMKYDKDILRSKNVVAELIMQD